MGTITTDGRHVTVTTEYARFIKRTDITIHTTGAELTDILLGLELLRDSSLANNNRLAAQAAGDLLRSLRDALNASDGITDEG